MYNKGKGQGQGQKQYEPDPAIGYVRKYNKDGQEKKYIRLIVNADVAGKLENEKGQVLLTGFFVGKKRNAKSPDIVFKATTTKATTSGDTSTDSDDDLPF